jgi:hypothetical protein
MLMVILVPVAHGVVVVVIKLPVLVLAAVSIAILCE